MINFTKKGKMTMAAVLLQAILVVVIETCLAAIFLKYFDALGGTSNQGAHRGVPVYLAIFILSQLFLVILTWDAIWHKNTIEVFGINAFNISCFVYALFQYFQMIQLVDKIKATTVSNRESDAQTIKILLTLVPVVIAVFQLIFAYFFYRLYVEFGWKSYKKIGADPEMRTMYRKYQIFLLLLKMNVFFIFGFSIQFLVLVIQANDPEFALTIIAMPVMLVVLLLAVYGVRKEDKWIMSLFIFGLFCALAYVTFKLVRIWTLKNKDEYQDTKNYLTLFSCLALFVVSWTIVHAILCYRCFGKGLKEALIAHKKEQAELKQRLREQAHLRSTANLKEHHQDIM